MLVPPPLTSTMASSLQWLLPLSSLQYPFIYLSSFILFSSPFPPLLVLPLAPILGRSRVRIPLNPLFFFCPSGEWSRVQVPPCQFFFKYIFVLTSLFIFYLHYFVIHSFTMNRFSKQERSVWITTAVRCK